MEIGRSTTSSRAVLVDAQMSTIPMTGRNVTETTFFNRIFPSDSGMRFNFDDIREFLHDPLIALIATDLTVSSMILTFLNIF